MAIERIQMYRPVRAKTGLGRKKASKLRKRPKRMTEAALWRKWLVPEGAYRRYKGLKGIYWYWLSRDVRKSEWETWGGLCLTCNEMIESWEKGQCGHIIPSDKCGGFLRFHRMNLTIQHPACNNPRFTPDAGILNAVNLNKRYGEDRIAYLLSLKKEPYKEPTKIQWEKMILDLQSYQQAHIRALQNL